MKECDREISPVFYSLENVIKNSKNLKLVFFFLHNLRWVKSADTET